MGTTFGSAGVVGGGCVDVLMADDPFDLEDFEDLHGPPPVQEQVMENSLVATFVHDRCEMGPARMVLTSAIFDAWKKWCTDSGLGVLGGPSHLGRALKSICGVRPSKPCLPGTPRGSYRPRRYIGVGLKEVTK